MNGAGPPSRRVTGIGIAGFTVQTELPPEQQAGWRRLGEQLLGLLDDQQTGLVITLDEIHGANRDELAQLPASVQHFIRAGLPVNLVFAGLPAAVSDLLDEGVATFLRRADRIDLHAAAIEEVEAYYRDVFAVLDHPINHALLHEAAEATGGYSFLIQLVGYHLWQVAESTNRPSEAEDVRVAVAAARRRNTRMVIEAALASTSPRTWSSSKPWPRMTAPPRLRTSANGSGMPQHRGQLPRKTHRHRPDRISRTCPGRLRHPRTARTSASLTYNGNPSSRFSR